MVRPRVRFALSKKQHDFFGSKVRFCLARGGRQSGKTTAGLARVSVYAKRRGTNGIIIVPSYPELSQNIIPKFMEFIPESWIARWRKTERAVETVFGSKIFFRSASKDDPKGAKRFRGPTWDWAWLDEPRNMSEEVWDTLEPSLMVKKAPAFFTTTPNGNDWVWKLFQRNDPDYAIFTMSSYDNPHADAKFINDLKRRLEEKGDAGMQLARQEIFAEIVEVGALCFFSLQLRGDLQGAIRDPKEITESISVWCEARDDANADHYLISADTGHGEASSDLNQAYVLDRVTGEVVASSRSRKNPKDYADDLLTLASMYKEPWMSIEDNDWGMAVITHLSEKGYPLLFRRRVYRHGRPTAEKRVGWHTDKGTRPTMLSTLRAMLNEGWLKVYDENFLHDARDFVLYNDAQPRAVKGSNDDCVMALAVAAATHAAMPEVTMDTSGQEPSNRERTKLRKEWLDQLMYGPPDIDQDPFDAVSGIGTPPTNYEEVFFG